MIWFFRRLSLIKFSRATSRVKWFKCPQYSEDEDRDGLRNVGFFTFQPFDLAGSPRELYYNKLCILCYFQMFERLTVFKKIDKIQFQLHVN